MLCASAIPALLQRRARLCRRAAATRRASCAARFGLEQTAVVAYGAALPAARRWTAASRRSRRGSAGQEREHAAVLTAALRALGGVARRTAAPARRVRGAAPRSRPSARSPRFAVELENMAAGRVLPGPAEACGARSSCGRPRRSWPARASTWSCCGRRCDRDPVPERLRDRRRRHADARRALHRTTFAAAALPCARGGRLRFQRQQRQGHDADQGPGIADQHDQREPLRPQRQAASSRRQALSSSSRRTSR